MTTLLSQPTDVTVNNARKALYRFLSLAFHDSRNGAAWQTLAAPETQACITAAAELIRHEPTMQPDELALGELPIEKLDPADAFERLPTSPERLAAEYEATFGLLVSGTAPPYETEYIDGKFTFQRSQHLADIAGFYRAYGLRPSDQHPERHDHIALELEFMASLIDLETRTGESAEASADERAAICRDAQAKFLKEHLAWWLPTFARLLDKERRNCFHAAAGHLLAALLPAERTRLGVPPAQALVAPSQVERPDECDGCVLQAAL